MNAAGGGVGIFEVPSIGMGFGRVNNGPEGSGGRTGGDENARVPVLELPTYVCNKSVPLFASESTHYFPLTFHARKQCRTAHDSAHEVGCSLRRALFAVVGSRALQGKTHSTASSGTLADIGQVGCW